MVGQITINYQPQSREERLLLEEIVQRTRESIDIERVGIEIYFETEERNEMELSFAEAEVNYKTRTGRVIIPAVSRRMLRPLALKGLVYSMIGGVLGQFFYEEDNNKEDKGIFSENKTPQREALFDYIMLHKGGTVEALIAYKVESIRRTIEFIRKQSTELSFNDEVRFDFGAFGTYCNQLDQLQENLGTTIYSLATQGIVVKPQEKRYEN